MSEMNEMSCALLADVAAELALGVLTGRERADAIEHLDWCEACREDVRKLMATGDELLALLPAREPPAGFETRVLDRLGLQGPGMLAARAQGRAVTIPIVAERGLSDRPRAGHRRVSGRRPRALPKARQLLAAAAIAIAIAGAGIGGWGMGTATAPAALSAASPLTSANLVSAGHQWAGQAFIYRNSPQWIYMSVEDLDSGDGTVTCQVIDADGHIVSIGQFHLSSGYGWWGGPVPGLLGVPRTARLVDARGTVLATASFTG